MKKKKVSKKTKTKQAASASGNSAANSENSNIKKITNLKKKVKKEGTVTKEDWVVLDSILKSTLDSQESNNNSQENKPIKKKTFGDIAKLPTPYPEAGSFAADSHEEVLTEQQEELLYLKNILAETKIVLKVGANYFIFLQDEKARMLLGEPTAMVISVNLPKMAEEPCINFKGFLKSEIKNLRLIQDIAKARWADCHFGEPIVPFDVRAYVNTADFMDYEPIKYESYERFEEEVLYYFSGTAEVFDIYERDFLYNSTYYKQQEIVDKGRSIERDNLLKDSLRTEPLWKQFGEKCIDSTTFFKEAYPAAMAKDVQRDVTLKNLRTAFQTAVDSNSADENDAICRDALNIYFKRKTGDNIKN